MMISDTTACLCFSVTLMLCFMQGGQTSTVHQTYRNLQDTSRVEPSRKDNSDFKTVCYFGLGKSYNGTLPPGLNVKLCTHIIMFASSIQDGQMFIDPSIVEPYLSKIPLMKKLNPSLKVLCCNGGNFTEVLATKANQTRFVHGTVPVLRKYGFDGLDLDWEFPAYMPYWYLPGQKHNFTLITQALRSEFEKDARASGRPRLLLSAAVAGINIIIFLSYEVDQLAKYLDFINLMTYDTHLYLPLFPFTGYNSPLYPSDSYLDKTVFKDFNTAWSATEWSRLGMNRTQIMVGVPFYGHKYQLADASSHGLYSLAENIGPNNELPYFKICQIVNDPKSHVVWDNSSLVPYVYRDKLWISYDNVQSITLKVRWTLQNKFGGTMVFSTDTDDYTGSCDGKTKWPLLSAVNSVIQKYSRPYL